MKKTKIKKCLIVEIHKQDAHYKKNHSREWIGKVGTRVNLKKWTATDVGYDAEALKGFYHGNIFVAGFMNFFYAVKVRSIK